MVPKPQGRWARWRERRRQRAIERGLRRMGQSKLGGRSSTSYTDLHGTGRSFELGAGGVNDLGGGDGGGGD